MEKNNFFKITPFEFKEFSSFQEALNDFNSKACFSTEELLKKIELDKAKIIEGKSFIILENQLLKKYILKIDELIDIIKKRNYPRIQNYDDNHWCYNIIYGKTQISFVLCKEVFYHDKKWHQIINKELEVVNFKSLTVNEYSQMYLVPTTTIRDWIRRGRLRNIEKINREWLIPEFEGPHLGKYVPANYQLDEPLSNLPNEFNYLNGYKYIKIEKIKLENKKYSISWFDDYAYYVNEKIIDEKEKERIERFILSLNAKETSNSLIYATNY